MLSRDRRDALTIEGLRYASRAKVLRVFAADFGRSIFSSRWTSGAAACWRSIGWKTPSVSRVWPDRLVVRIRERKPVAFVYFGARRAADRRPGRAARSAAAGATSPSRC